MSRGLPAFSEKARLYIEHYEMIGDIHRAYEDDVKEIFDYLRSAISQRLGAGWVIDFRSTRSYQQIFRESWRSKDLWIHYEFHSGQDSLPKRSFHFMVDVEGKGAKRFFSLFESKYESFRDLYASRDIEYRPRGRKVAMAWKEYDLDTDLAKLDERFIEALDEFTFLTDVIEETIRAYHG